MACACKVNQKLDYLTRKYGTQSKSDSRKKGITLTPGMLLSSIGVVFIQLLFIPIALPYIVYKGVIRKKPISIAPVLNVGH